MAKGFRVVSRGAGNLQTRYRPQRLSEIAPTFPIRRIKKILDDPNASQVYLFEGITGTGKTTCARIIARAAICECEDPKVEKPCLECDACEMLDTCGDLYEVNVANDRSIEHTRHLIDKMRFRPQYLKKKIIILDEVHQFLGPSQEILLKALEEPPSDVLIFLCTTDRTGLRRTLLSRTEEVKFKRVTRDHAMKLISQISEDNGVEVPAEIASDIYRRADGSVRDVLRWLSRFFDDDFQTAEDEAEEVSADVKALAKVLMNRDWSGASAILKTPGAKKAPESLRIGVTSYLRAVCLNKPHLASAQVAAGPLGQLIGPLEGGAAMQYNQLVLRCMRGCFSK